MAKRARGDSLTGGSKDVNPQWFNASGTQTGADVNTTVSFPLPVQRLSQKKGMSLVMEILKVAWDTPYFVLTGNSSLSIYGLLTTKDPIVPATITNTYINRVRSLGSTIDYINRQMAADVGPTNEVVVDEPIFHDLTDGAGHGILVATDTIYLTITSNAAGNVTTGVVNFVTAKILYRFKEVTLEEYIGIVQSQQ